METNQNICIRCGLCCDGTLFKKAYIEEEEIITSSFLFDIDIDENDVTRDEFPDQS